MSAPAALVMAKLMFPEKEKSHTAGKVDIEVERPGPTSSTPPPRARRRAEAGAQRRRHADRLRGPDRAARLADRLVGRAGRIPGALAQRRARLGVQPARLADGVPWAEADKVGTLIGIKTAVNEFVGYVRLEEMVRPASSRSARRDRHLRPVRLLELLLDRDPDRRHRRMAPERRPTWRGWACARWWPARSPASRPRPSPASCCDGPPRLPGHPAPRHARAGARGAGAHGGGRPARRAPFLPLLPHRDPGCGCRCAGARVPGDPDRGPPAQFWTWWSRPRGSR